MAYLRYSSLYFHYSSSSLHKEICVIYVAAPLLFLGFITHLDHINLYRIQGVLKMYSRLFLVQTTSRLVHPLVPTCFFV